MNKPFNEMLEEFAKVCESAALNSITLAHQVAGHDAVRSRAVELLGDLRLWMADKPAGLKQNLDTAIELLTTAPQQMASQIDVPHTALTSMGGADGRVRELSARFNVPVQAMAEIMAHYEGADGSAAEKVGSATIAHAIRDVCKLDYTEHGQTEDLLGVTVGDLRRILERHFGAFKASADEALNAARLQCLMDHSHNGQFELISQKWHLTDPRGRSAGSGATKIDAIDAALKLNTKGAYRPICGT